MIIDPPVHIGSPRADIEAWIRKLEKMRAEAGTDLVNRRTIDDAIEEAREWLKANEEFER